MSEVPLSITGNSDKIWELRHFAILSEFPPKYPICIF